MAYLHTLGAGFLYRDTKPANILLPWGLVEVTSHSTGRFEATNLGALRDEWSIRLADFGTACDQNQVPDNGGVPVTTPAYAAPKVLASPGPPAYTFASDVWSIEVILAELLSKDAMQSAL